jgi:type VI secretion system FHA domain protein
MPLTLKIVSKQRHILGADSVRVFSVRGGSIGRASDNDWVLPDPDRYISGHHASIDYRDGAYYLRDTSTNGVYVNRSDQPVGRGAPLRLYDGDELRMGDYVFQTIIVNVSRDGEDDSGDDDGEPRLRVRRKKEDPSALSLKLLGDQADELEDSAEPKASAFAKEVEDFAATVRITEEEVETRAEAELEAGVDLKKVTELKFADSAHTPVDNGLGFDTTVLKDDVLLSTGSGRRDFTEAVRQLMDHAGLELSHLSTEEEDKILDTFGRMARLTVEGLQSLLQARAQMKGQFRISQTGFQSVANNPLKLITETHEALQTMIKEDSEGYLGALEAVEEAFEDLKAHQAATTKGMQVAVRELLDKLAPAELEQRFQPSVKPGSTLTSAQKSRNWELYRDAYQSIAGFSEDNFASVIGARFADAYDREIERTRSRRKRRPR